MGIHSENSFQNPSLHNQQKSTQTGAIVENLVLCVALQGPMHPQVGANVTQEVGSFLPL